MNHLLPGEYARLVDSAKREAALLRRESFNGWLDDAGHTLGHPVRSAQRLAASLARHARLRSRQGA